MSNGLTGDYDAVVEVGVGAVNRILGTLHQKGAYEDASPSLLHSFTTRVGDAPKVPRFELAEVFLLQNFGAEVGDIRDIPQDVLKDVQEDLLEIQRDLSRVLDTSDSAGGGLATVLANIPELFVVRGTAKVQASTPTITLPQGSTSEVTVHCQIRAHYWPDPGTAALPEPIHGEVQATFVIEFEPLVIGNSALLEAKVTEDDAKILFVPAPGTSLTSAEAKQIAREIRRSLRTKFEPMNVELPESFPFRQFKALGSGSTQAIALPVMLSEVSPDSSALDSVGNLFLGSSDDFAIAISKDYIETLLQPTLDELEEFSDSFTVVDVTVPAPPPWWSVEINVTYDVSVSSVTVAWPGGKIVLTIEGEATTSSIAPDYDFTITQELTLALDSAGQIVFQPPPDPQISGNLPGFAKNEVKDRFKDERKKALDEVQPEIQKQMDSISFDDALKEFDASAASKYTSLEIQPDGVVLRGKLTVSQRPDVFVDVAETPDGSALTAFKSWIPAGTIEKYVWSWVSTDPSTPAPTVPWGGIEHEVIRAHSFIYAWHPGGGSAPGAEPGEEQPPEPKPPPWELYQMCIQVEGTQIGSTTGTATPVSGGTICKVQQPEWVATVPSWWDAVLLGPVWGPDPGPEDVLDNAIVAHINVGAEARRAEEEAKTTSIIHFADGQSGSPLPVLSEALLQSRHRDAAVPVILVLRSGSFEQTRSSMERRLGSLAQELSGPLLITEDYEGGWTRAFSPSGGSATYLMSAEGELVWQHEGPPDAASLTSALDEHVIPGGQPRSRLMRLAVQAGEPAPDFLFEYAQGQRIALRRLHRQRVLLNFWKSWSTQCLTELRRLQSLHHEAGRQGPLILAIGDGEDSQRVAEIGREHDLRFILVPDPDRQIARRYGIACWPTTVSVNEDGLIGWVHFGVTHGRSAVELDSLR